MALRCAFVEWIREGRREEMAAESPARDDTPTLTRPPWFYGPSVDLFFGAGGLYLLSFIPLLFLASSAGLSDWSLGLTSAFIILINVPHYGATLVRVYERREDRRHYAFFSIGLSAVCLLAFLVALEWHWLGSLLLGIYITWTPWHFAGQNYGVALAFLRRSGTEITPLAKRLFYSSFVLSAILAFLSIHVQDGSAVYSAGVEKAGVTYSVLRLGIPIGLTTLVAIPLALAYLGCSLVPLWLFARNGRPRDIAGPAMLVLTQALWFTVPAIMRLGGIELATHLAFAAIWVSTSHSLQYHWITTYYARHAKHPMDPPRYYLKAVALGSLINVVPGLIFAPAVLGKVSWEAGLSVLVFSVVNIHHFMLDGAVWKLREGVVARALLRTDRGNVGAGNEDDSSGAVWRRRAVYALGIATLAVPLVVAWETVHTIPNAAGDIPTLERSARNLSLVGRDIPLVLTRLGMDQLAAGKSESAIANLRKAVEVRPDSAAKNNLAWVLATTNTDDPESLSEALVLAREASEERGNQDPVILDTLAVIYAAQGDYASAVREARNGMRIARARGQEALAKEIQTRLRQYRAQHPSRKKGRSPRRAGTDS